MSHFDLNQVGGDRFLMQLGTLSGNPIAAVAGLKTMEVLRRDGAYDKLHHNGSQLMQMLREELDRTGQAFQISGHPALFDVVFTDQAITDYRSWFSGDMNKAVAFTRDLRARGILKSPTKLYPSVAITDGDLDQTRQAIRYAAERLG